MIYLKLWFIGYVDVLRYVCLVCSVNCLGLFVFS